MNLEKKQLVCTNNNKTKLQKKNKIKKTQNKFQINKKINPLRNEIIILYFKKKSMYDYFSLLTK